MLKKILLISLVVLGLVVGANASDFSPKYDKEAECFMSLDYLDYQGPAPRAWFVDKTSERYGRNYINQDGDIWRNRIRIADEVNSVFPAKTAMDAWLCPEMLLAAATPVTAAVVPVSPKTFIVYFDFDKSVIKADQVPVLEDAIAYAQQNGYLQIDLASFCDFRGGDDYNVNLSKRRSAAVQSWMIENGIGTGDFTVEDNGKFKSFVHKLEGKYCAPCWEDRRVEITIK
jgi:outer membrane protein OmpA-like peptidoglycan-associated protein